MQKFVITFASAGTVVGRTTATAETPIEAARQGAETKRYAGEVIENGTESFTAHSGKEIVKHIFLVNDTKIIVQVDSD
jgi:hypothetical protein